MRSRALLPDLERTDQERLGTRVRALRFVEGREVVEAGSDIGVVRSSAFSRSERLRSASGIAS
jgi:hypothetical protein